jgi:nitronate monooxygenase
VEAALNQILNLLLESERAGVVALERLAAEVDNPDLKKLLTTSREDEAGTVRALEELIRTEGGNLSQSVGPFAAKLASAAPLPERLQLLIRGEEWVARKIEQALALAPSSGKVHDYLTKMARRHRFEVEWGRAELIRLMNTL